MKKPMEQFVCSNCKKQKPYVFTGLLNAANGTWIYLSLEGFKVNGRLCLDCRRRRARGYYKTKNRRLNYRLYEKTKFGFLMRAYRNMQSRVCGIQKKKAHLYKGLELLKRKDFYEWANNNTEFHRLFDDWEKSKYKRTLCPSVDRINVQLGYVIHNMQWLTHSENSKKITRRLNDKTQKSSIYPRLPYSTPR